MLVATPDQQIRMLTARFQSGAWGIAGNYLRQAESAELRTWGRQRDADGALLDLVSFAGVSPLALPPDGEYATVVQGSGFRLRVSDGKAWLDGLSPRFGV